MSRDWRLDYKKETSLQELTRQSVFRAKHDKKFRYFCPLCNHPSSTPLHPEPFSFKNVSRVLLASLLIMGASWNFFEWRGVLSFVPLWICFEVIYRLTVRTRLNCSNCGFDPILFLANPDKARQELKGYWRKKLELGGIPFKEEKGRLIALRKSEAKVKDEVSEAELEEDEVSGAESASKEVKS